MQAIARALNLRIEVLARRMRREATRAVTAAAKTSARPRCASATECLRPLAVEVKRPLSLPRLVLAQLLQSVLERVMRASNRRRREKGVSVAANGSPVSG